MFLVMLYDMMKSITMKRFVLILLLVTITATTLSVSTVLAARAPATPPRGSDFAARLRQRKIEREIKLEDRDKTRIDQTCIAAQGKVRSLYQEATAAINQRNVSYQRVDAKLWVIIGRLRLAEQDTFELEKQRINLANRINDFQTTGNNYTEVLDDIQVVNCKADPEGFKALLDTARIYHKQIVDKSNALHEYVVNDIKKTLTGHVTDLQPKAETE